MTKKCHGKQRLATKKYANSLTKIVTDHALGTTDVQLNSQIIPQMSNIIAESLSMIGLHPLAFKSC